jgi:hypothetical protein
MNLMIIAMIKIMNDYPLRLICMKIRKSKKKLTGIVKKTFLKIITNHLMCQSFIFIIQKMLLKIKLQEMEIKNLKKRMRVRLSFKFIYRKIELAKI